MLAADRAAQAPDQLVGLLGDRAHLVDLGGVVQVEVRPRVALAVAGVGEVGDRRAVAAQDRLQAVDVLGELLHRHRHVLDEGDGLLLAGHAEQQRHGRLAGRPDHLLLSRIDDLVPLDRPVDGGRDLREFLADLLERIAVVLDDEAGGHVGRGQGLGKVRVSLAGDVRQGLVHEFARGGLHQEDCRGGPGGVVERGKVQLDQGLDLRPAHQPQCNFADDRQCALRTGHQPMRVDVSIQHRPVQVVPAAIALALGPAVGDCLLLRGQQIVDRHGQLVSPVGTAAQSVDFADRHAAQCRDLPVRQDHFHRIDMGLDVSVLDRVGSRRVVRGDSPDARPRSAGWVGPELPAKFGNPRVEPFEHYAGLAGGQPLVRVEQDHLVEQLRRVHHDAAAEALASQAAAGAASGNRNAVLSRESHRRLHVLDAARQHHAGWADLVDAGVGAPERQVQRVVVYQAGHQCPEFLSDHLRRYCHDSAIPSTACWVLDTTTPRF